MLINRIPGATRVIGKVQGYLGLPIRDDVVECSVNGPNTPSMTTSWQPTPEELDRLQQGASVHVTLLGRSHPPIIVSVGEAPDQ